MNDLNPSLVSDSTANDGLDTRGLRLGFVRHEPLDTMLKLERSPPPILTFDTADGSTRQTAARTVNPNSDAQRLQAIKMQLNLANLVLTSEEDIIATEDPRVIAGLHEVHRFLLHTEHLRMLQEA